MVRVDHGLGVDLGVELGIERGDGGTDWEKGVGGGGGEEG